MATSGSIDFLQTRDEIISDALSLLEILGSGETAVAADITLGASLLNKMIKSWQAQGIHLWAESECIIALRSGVNTYTLSSTGDKAGDSAEFNTLTAGSASGATTITLSSVDGLANSDNIGIELDDNTRQWTTISSINTSTKVVTLNTTLTAAASSGNTVITYTTILNRPLNLTAVRYKYSTGMEREMVKKGRTDFMNIPNKSSEDAATTYYFSPQLNNSKLYIWPTPTNCGDCLTASYIRTIEDFDSSSNNPDFPQEWLETLTYNLAMRLAPAFGINLTKVKPEIIALAASSLEELKLWDGEEGSMFIVPNYNWDN